MAYIYRSNSSASGTTATISAWVKSVDTSVDAAIFQFKSSSNTISFYTNPNSKFRVYTSGSYSTGDLVNDNRKFRDFGGWWHLVATIDTTNSTSGDRLRVYINGERQTDFTTETYPSISQSYAQLVSGNFELGKYGSTDRPTYLAHVHYCDGYAYNADSFGSTDATTGQWKINTSPNVQYGTNGVFLKFANSGALGTDSSGNNNTMSISGTPLQTQDNPSNNFATLNILNPQTSGYTLANGNLSVTANTGDAWRTMYATIGASSGKYYWEQKITNFTGVDPHYIGIVSDDQMSNTNIDQATTSRGYFYTKTGARRNNNSQTSYGDSWTTNDIVGIALDLDNSKLYFSKNGTWQDSGDPTSGSTGTGAAFTITSGYIYVPATSTYYSNNQYDMNFGNGFFGTTAISSEGTNASNIGKFEYDVPTGYTALSTKGLNE